MSLNVLNEVEKIKIENTDHILGKGLQMPFAASNSGSRKLMFGTQLEHRLPLLKPDVPFIETGYEMEFGKNSSSYIKTDDFLEVIGKVEKFSNSPTHHFYVFAVNPNNETICVFERKEYKHVTENYGYLFDNTKLDSFVIGSNIPEGTIIQKSMAFDEYNNRMDGKNLLTYYTACEETMEDAIIISESASKKLSSPLIKKVTVIINDNDIPLNLYGNYDNYKIFPDIGEETQNGLLCGLRREKKEECLFSQSWNRLRELTISDDKYTVSGRVVDIDVYCNSPEKLTEYEYNKQIKYYYEDNLRMCREIIEILNPFIQMGYKMDYDLQRLYSICNGTINGKQYFSDKVFSNMIIEITLIEEIPVKRGDKLSNRYGGKGITSKIVPDNLMPRTENGQVIDIILNMCGVYGRENAGQLFEITVSYISNKILEFIETNVLDAFEAVQLYLDMLKIVSPSMYEWMKHIVDSFNETELVDFFITMSSGQNAFYIAIEPMSENMTIDKVKELYDEFPWIVPETMFMPIVNSVGKIRYVPSRRPLIYGYQYIYRLKQYAEEKFSVTSLSATNIRNENSKSRSANNYRALYSRTPIRFGDMEIGNLTHLGSELIVQMLMLYSTSPHARRLTSEMLTGNAFNIDIKLDDSSKNRNAEILNVYLKTMGLKLVFVKKPKKKENPMTLNLMTFLDHDLSTKDLMSFFDEREKFDIEADVERLIKENKTKDLMSISLMSFYK